MRNQKKKDILKKPFKNIKVIYTHRQGEDIVGCENIISLLQRRSKRITARRYKYDEWVKEPKEGNEQKEMKELHNEPIRKK